MLLKSAINVNNLLGSKAYLLLTSFFQTVLNCLNNLIHFFVLLFSQFLRDGKTFFSCTCKGYV